MCENCKCKKEQELDHLKCPSCGSENILIEKRMNGYTYCSKCGYIFPTQNKMILDKKENKIEVKFVKTHPLAQLPVKNNADDTGYDIFSVEEVVVPAKGSAKIDCGLMVAYISPGYWFSSRSRSGMFFKNDILSFHGTIDRGYRNKLGLKLYNLSDVDYVVRAGDKVCQIAIAPIYDAEMSFVDSVVDETTRGQNGFGSSGK